MNKRRPSLASRLAPHGLAVAAALACGTLLNACGGGGGDAASTAVTLSESDATADAANASSTGTDTAAAMDTVIDTTSALAVTVSTSSAVAERAHALSANPSAVLAPIDVTVSCAGGGTATVEIAGSTPGNELNGVLDAGEVYTVTYAQCAGRAGDAQLNGGVQMQVVSADQTTSPSSLSVALTLTNLALALPAGTATLSGTATVSRSVATSNGSTTTTSQVTVPGATLATAFNARSATFTLTDLDATRTVTSVAGIATASQYAGHHTLSGTANGRTFSMTVATTGAMSYDAAGGLVSGAWTVVRPQATVATSVANGTVTLTVDDGNDGTIDHTWTFPTATLNAAAG